MNKPYLLIGLLLGLIAGYFAGREHLKYEMRTTVGAALEEAREAFGGRNVKAKERVTPKEATKAVEDWKRYAATGIALTNLEIENWKSRDGELCATLRGELKNLGTNTLKQVRLTVFFKDASGKDVFEDESPLIRAGLFDADQPLKPNYAMPFKAMTTKIPSGWDRSSYRIAISGVEFLPAD